MTRIPTKTVKELIDALKDLDDDTIIEANHSTAEIYAKDAMGKPYLIFSFSNKNPSALV